MWRYNHAGATASNTGVIQLATIQLRRHYEHADTGDILKSMIIGKSRDLIKLIAAARLCPNKLRAALMRQLGWKIGTDSILYYGVVPIAPNVSIGSNTVINIHAFFDGLGTIEIGDSVRIGPYLKILSTTHPIENALPRRIAGKDFNLHTRIGFGCWVGTSVMILPGVDVAEGCVLAAGCVVTKSTEPNGLYAGVPARRIRDLPLTPA